MRKIPYQWNFVLGALLIGLSKWGVTLTRTAVKTTLFSRVEKYDGNALGRFRVDQVWRKSPGRIEL